MCFFEKDRIGANFYVSWNLKEGWEEAISVYLSQFAKLQIYTEMVLKLVKVKLLVLLFNNIFKFGARGLKLIAWTKIYEIFNWL